MTLDLKGWGCMGGGGCRGRRPPGRPPSRLLRGYFRIALPPFPKPFVAVLIGQSFVNANITPSSASNECQWAACPLKIGSFKYGHYNCDSSSGKSFFLVLTSFCGLLRNINIKTRYLYKVTNAYETIQT